MATININLPRQGGTQNKALSPADKTGCLIAISINLPEEELAPVGNIENGNEALFLQARQVARMARNAEKFCRTKLSGSNHKKILSDLAYQSEVLASMAIAHLSLQKVQ